MRVELRFIPYPPRVCVAVSAETPDDESRIAIASSGQRSGQNPESR